MKSNSKRNQTGAHGRRQIVRRWTSAAGLALLGVGLAAAGAEAQVPQDVTFRGRLVDAAGTPQTGPVNLELRVFDAETAATELYAESHTGVSLDAIGAFAVQLGLGTPLSGTFDASLFSDVDRWLEVVVDGNVLSPRHIIASVPWALIAQQANEIVPDPNGPFKDCGDGTVADPQTGLLWEKKTGTVGGGADSSDPHNVSNSYTWSFTGTNPDGGVFTDFLAKLNDQTFGETATPSGVTGCFAGHCDWRLPTIVELQTILDCAFGPPCIDPIFGLTDSRGYWSASSTTSAPFAFFARFQDGALPSLTKISPAAVRAVRAGSCN